MMLGSDEMERYDRQIILPEIGRNGQKKLAESKVLVIGAGGLGSQLHFILLRQHCFSAVRRSSLRCGRKNRLL